MEQIMEFAGNHPLLSGGFIAVLGLLIWTELARKVQGFRELTPGQAVALINDSNTVVVDVSSTADFNKGHIVNARNITMSRLSKPDTEIEKLKGHKLLLVCKSGQTAAQAGGLLKKIGVTDIAILKGGMLQWKSDNFPVTNK